MTASFTEEMSADTGAVVRIEVGLTKADRNRRRRVRQAIPQPVELMALLDTGAQTTCINPATAVRLVLPLKNARLTNAPGLSGLRTTLTREVSLTILHPSGDPLLHLVIPVIEVTELDLGSLGYDALIGRDVLAKCVLTYDGPANSFTLSY
jgi:hypothetical protein